MPVYKCSSCHEDLPPDNDYVSCLVRNCKLHYSCAGISEKTYRTMGKQRLESYKCVLCRNVDKDPATPTSTPSKSITDQDILKIILDKFDAFETKITKKFESEFAELRKSVDFCCDKIDDFGKEILEMNKKISFLEKSKTELENKNKILTQQVDQLFLQFEEMQQYSRNVNLQIDGVPETSNENVMQIVNKLSIAIDEPIVLNQDIQAAHRLASSNKNRPRGIVIRFSNRQKRDNVLEKCKKAKLTSTTFVENVPATPVYVNEHLTLYYKKLLYEAKTYKFAKKVKYVWVKNSKILMRESDNSTIVRITKYDDLARNFGVLENK